jgi:hypothetical protein
MKLYDLKLKEIEVLDRKIKEEEDALSVGKPKKVSKAKKLKAKLKQDKKKVKEVVRKVASQHDDLIKVVEAYNKDFADKHRSNLKAIFTNITLEIKGQMAKKHFHDAYKKFMVNVVKRVQSLSPDQLKHHEATAKKLVADYFTPVLNEMEKKSEEKKHAKTVIKKAQEGQQKDEQKKLVEEAKKEEERKLAKASRRRHRRFR